MSIFQAVNSPVTDFPPPLSDTPQHWLQPLISNQAWACVSCSTIYSRPANSHKSTSKICLRTISFKRTKLSDTTRYRFRTDTTESISSKGNSTQSPSPIQSCQRFGVPLWKKKKKAFKSVSKASFPCERLHWCAQELVRAQAAVGNHMSLSIRRKDDIILLLVNMSRASSQMSHIITLLNTSRLWLGLTQGVQTNTHIKSKSLDFLFFFLQLWPD